jgi:hypothetical protein
MPFYRVYFIGQDGHFTSVTDLDCVDDDAAIRFTMRLVNGNDVEVWQGARKLAAFEHKPESSGHSITHEIHDGRMISKPAE